MVHGAPSPACLQAALAAKAKADAHILELRSLLDGKSASNGELQVQLAKLRSELEAALTALELERKRVESAKSSMQGMQVCASKAGLAW